MSDDPLYVESLVIQSALSLEIEAQMRDAQMNPIKAMLAHAREQAAAALRNLVDVDPSDRKTIIALQTDARRYGDMVRFLRDIFHEGQIAEERLRDLKHDDVSRLILEDDEEARALFGIEKRGPGSE